MIKAVFLDIDGTLLNFEACVEKAMQKGLKKWGVAYSSKMLETFHEINNGLWRQIEDKTLTFEELTEIRFNTVFKALGIEGINGKEFEAFFRTALNESAIPVKGATEILRYLFEKYKIYGASNGPHEQQVGRLKKAGMLEYFSFVFTSELVGHEKPRKEFFDYCFGKLENILPQETVIIGDSLTSDIQGGKNYKMQTIWYDKDGKIPPKSIIPDYTVSYLEEIKNIL